MARGPSLNRRARLRLQRGRLALVAIETGGVVQHRYLPPHDPLYFHRFREPVDHALAEDEFAVERDFERAALAGRDGDAATEDGAKIMQQVLRQTGGSREIPSAGAVLDPHVRNGSLNDRVHRVLSSGQGRHRWPPTASRPILGA